MKRFKRVLLSFVLFAVAMPASAATATTTFAVSGTVVPTCSVSATPMSFGAAIPNPINSNVDATSTVTATCSSGAPYTIALSAGLGAGATFAARRMTSGPNGLTYTLFTDAGRATVWGDGTAGNTLSNNNGSGSAQVISVFGRIPAPQTVPTGTYTDTITVTVTF